MKISKETISLLKNFSSINSNLLIKKGSSLSTMNAQKNVLADVIVTETFPIDFGIYDTNEFLGIISLFNEPEIEFKESYATIKEGSSSVKFYAADSSVLTVPAKKVTFPNADVSFSLTSTQLATIQKTASVLRAVDVSIIGKNGALSILVGDLKNATSNNFNVEIGETEKEFTANLKIENLKMMPGLDYEVSISSKKISRFVSNDLTYFVALESTSEF